MHSSAGFLNLCLLQHKEEHGTYPNDLNGFIEGDFFIGSFPEKRRPDLAKLLGHPTFDYGGNDAEKDYLFRYNIDGDMCVFPK